MPDLPPRPVPRRNETQQLTRPIEAALNAVPGVWAARNNVGSAVTRNGWPIVYGLGNGSADIVGSVHVPATLLTPSMARAFALEVKWPGKKPRGDQVLWQAQMRERGWVVEVVHSVAEALEVVRGMQRQSERSAAELSRAIAR